MEESLKKFIEDQVENLAGMVAKGFEQTATKQEVQELRQEMATMHDEIGTMNEKIATKEDIVRLERTQQENDTLRDRMRVLGTRVDRLEVTLRWPALSRQ